MSTKLYVGNLSYNATEQDLMDLFSQAGGIETIKIIKDPYTGKAKGFGFIEMTSHEEAQNAINKLNGKSFMERTLTVNEARPQEKRSRGFGGGGGNKGNRGRKGGGGFGGRR